MTDRNATRPSASWHVQVLTLFPEMFPGPLGLSLAGKALAAYRAYEAAGYVPIPIRDYSHLVGGNTHCITNVLD